MSNVSANNQFPVFISAGDILTDLVRTGAAQWLSVPGGAGWNVARCVARLGLPTACVGSLGVDNFSDDLWNASVAAGLDMRFMQRVARPPLLAVVHQTHPPAYFFMGENSADLAFDPSRLPAGWADHVFERVTVLRFTIQSPELKHRAATSLGGRQLQWPPLSATSRAPPACRSAPFHAR